MTNQRAVASSNTSNSPSIIVPTIIAQPAPDQPSHTITASSNKSVNTAVNASLSVATATHPTENASINSSQSDPCRDSKPVTADGSPGLDVLSSFSTTLPHVCLPPPAHPLSLANALRAVKEGTIPSISLHEHPGPLISDSPYAKSISSTAPGSPRM